MSNEIVFFGLLFIFLSILIKRDALSSYLLEKMDINISSKTLLNIAIVGIVILMILGILLDNTKEKYSNISDSYNSMRPNVATVEEKSKPHRWFDIDFKSIFPWN